jgi:hypothetical protein
MKFINGNLEVGMEEEEAICIKRNIYIISI